MMAFEPRRLHLVFLRVNYLPANLSERSSRGGEDSRPNRLATDRRSLSGVNAHQHVNNRGAQSPQWGRDVGRSDEGLIING
jgi:hypothetical protein